MKLLPVQMTDNSTMFFVNLDNLLISTVGIHPGIFFKKTCREKCCLSWSVIYTQSGMCATFALNLVQFFFIKFSNFQQN